MGEEEAEQAVGKGENPFAAAEVLGQRQDLVMWLVRLRPGLCVFLEQLGCRQPEPVDALLDVPHPEEVGAFAFARHRAEQRVLGRVDVLTLVHEHVIQTLPPGRRDRRRLTLRVEQQLQGELLEVREIHTAQRPFGPGVPGAKLPRQLEQPPHRASHPRPLHPDRIRSSVRMPGAEEPGLLEKPGENLLRLARISDPDFGAAQRRRRLQKLKNLRVLGPISQPVESAHQRRQARRDPAHRVSGLGLAAPIVARLQDFQGPRHATLQGGRNLAQPGPGDVPPALPPIPRLGLCQPPQLDLEQRLSLRLRDKEPVRLDDQLAQAFAASPAVLLDQVPGLCSRPHGLPHELEPEVARQRHGH